MKFTKKNLMIYLKEELEYNQNQAKGEMGMCYTERDNENWLRSRASYEAKADMIEEILEKFEL